MIQNSKREQIIKETQIMIQTKGFKEFSLNLLGKKLNIHRSTILYYFSDREELLGEALKQYRLNFLEELEEIKKENTSLKNKLNKYIKIHEEVLLNRDKICLCAALGSDFPSLPESVKNQILIHLKENENFIFEITNNNLDQENLMYKSEFFVESLQGIMIVCRNENDLKKYLRSTKLLIKTLYDL
ncbi:MAG: TetR/AcrR family transcriptional regulator [Crocosphaera sp.]|nr:TetR/AcrR family transcriptional regulator [Crocosphaera sp.]